MASAFHYRPKFVDIRASRPAATAKGPAARARACDHAGCADAGEHRAPKSRERANDFWYFCQAHAAEYNRRWNYFAGMSAEEYDAHLRAEEAGHRPTWTFRGSKRDRLSAAMRNFQGGRRADPHGLFGKGEAQGARAPRVRELTRLQILAFEVLLLNETADAAAVRASYAELVKRYHPDSNGGDRGAEAQLTRVIRAYQALKSAGLA